jgi:hypothetical protein
MDLLKQALKKREAERQRVKEVKDIAASGSATSTAAVVSG